MSAEMRKCALILPTRVVSLYVEEHILEETQKQYLRTDTMLFHWHIHAHTHVHTHTQILSFFLRNGRISAKVMEYTPPTNSSEQHAEGRCLGSGRRHWGFIWSQEKCNPSVLYPGQLLSTIAEKNSSLSADNISK